MERDRHEFTEFYAAARDDCLRVVLIAVGDRELAEDLVAEAFTRAWRSWRTVREHPAGRAWIVRTALNAHVSWWRRRRREVTVASHDDQAAACGPRPALDSSLVTALRRLPARQREVITLRLLLDLDTATTAATLGMPSGTVASHLSRGLATLRRELQSDDEQEEPDERRRLAGRRGEPTRRSASVPGRRAHDDPG
ncbi:MAG TPA: sigma-70 family RNA polymerase sigma factor [Streptosporangiaceae bacterium]|nr:sigma-70 family RNA polymerase sigma factor [Streptosporangiaceae bacterium]